MQYKKTVQGIVFDIANTLLMIILFIMMIYPFLYVLNYSLSSPGKITNPLLLIPQGFTTSAYAIVFKDKTILNAFIVSVARSVLGPILMLLISGMAAYVLSRKQLIFGKFFRILIFFTMYFSAGVIPVYLLYKSLHLTGSFWVYIIPNLVSTYSIVLIKTYIESIPNSLEEAVFIDGGNEMHVYWLVLFPICLPVNASVLLFSAITHWNSFIDTQLYNAMDSGLYTLQYLLYNTLAVQMQKSLEDAIKNLDHAQPNSQSLKMAITVITIIPVMCVYPFLQRYFVSGIMIGSIKA